MRDRFSRASCFPTGQSSVRPSISIILCSGASRNIRDNLLLANLSITDWLRLTISASALRSKTQPIDRRFWGKQPDLFAFGPITRGTFGEMTGAPDILRHIEHVVPTLIEPREQMRTNGLKTLAS